ALKRKKINRRFAAALKRCFPGLKSGASTWSRASHPHLQERIRTSSIINEADVGHRIFFGFARAKARENKSSLSRSAEALLPRTKVRGFHQKAGSFHPHLQKRFEQTLIIFIADVGHRAASPFFASLTLG